MGRLFVIEKEGPVYTCSSCGTQIAHRDHLLDDWTNFHEFSQVYNTVTGESIVPYASELFHGYGISCVECSTPLGWKEHKEADGHEPLYHMFKIQHGKVVPPPEVQSPPLEVQPPPPEVQSPPLEVQAPPLEVQPPPEVQSQPDVQPPLEVQSPPEVESPPEVV